MKILGIVGWSGSGKTTLLVALLPLFRARGLTVSTIKHAHHGFDMDRPGKDTFRHRAAGAHEVLVASSARWALLHEVAREEPSLPVLLGKLDPVDLVLVEGFKSHPFPKLEVYRAALDKPPIWPDQPDVVAVATDAKPDNPTLQAAGRAILPLNDPSSVVDWIALYLDIPTSA